ncbi:hypothetical protein G7054_g479 [Neopestalotiopsis clavispora]|nr:hypothetical protein G7054_g479 [Neopestalotiopsis clavispora]
MDCSSPSGPTYELDAGNDAIYQHGWARLRQDFAKQTETIRQMTETIRQCERGACPALKLERADHVWALTTARENTEALHADMKIRFNSKDEELYKLRQELEQCRAEHEEEVRRIRAEREDTQKENIELHYKLQQLDLEGLEGLEHSESPIESEEMLELNTATHIEPDTDYTANYTSAQKPRFSLCLHHRWCFFVGPADVRWQFYDQHLVQMKRPQLINSITINMNTFVARYDDWLWVRSYNLAYHYPLLEKAFDQHGLQTLEVCFLGPAVWYRGGNGYFFARWQDGSVVMLGDRVFMAEISTVAASVVAVTFGVEDTFVFTYVTNKGTISHVWHLGGYYKQLGEILRNNNNTFTIEAIDLDDNSFTDYAMITSERKWEGTLAADAGGGSHWESTNEAYGHR